MEDTRSLDTVPDDELLRLSEFEAYLRITVARAARQHPVLFEMLREGSLHLTAIAKLAPHLTRENRETLLARAAHRTKREVEELIAEIAPRPDAQPWCESCPTAAWHRRIRSPTRLEPSRLARRPLGLDRVEPPRLRHAAPPP